MADIHVGKMEAVGGEARGRARLVYHIPVDSPKEGVVPTPTSELSAIDQAEAEALAAGTLVEMSATITVTGQQSQADVVAKLREDWHNRKEAFNTRYAMEYRFYGVTLSATA